MKERMAGSEDYVSKAGRLHLTFDMKRLTKVHNTREYAFHYETRLILGIFLHFNNIFFH